MFVGSTQPDNGSEENATSFLTAMGELDECVLRQGAFGESVELLQSNLSSAVGPVPSRAAWGHLAHEIKRQLMALKIVDPASQWMLHFGRQCPKISDIALRLLMMGTQSADVERVCKAHKIVHSKVRNRLTDKNVKMLLYCYVNQRLIKKMELQNKGKNFDSSDVMEDFLAKRSLFIWTSLTQLRLRHPVMDPTSTR